VRVLECVGQALLHDAVGGEVDPARKREGLSVDVELDGKARARDFLEERVETVEAWLWHERDLVTVVAHRPEETTHLGERSATGPLDASQSLAVVGELFGELVPDSPDLEHHHADRVRHDVVELARDPRPLLGHGEACSGLPFPLGPHGTCLRRLGLLRSRAQSEAHGPGDSELDGNQDELCGRVAGML
jgi:hypothetical protein